MPIGIAKSGKRKCSPRSKRVVIVCEACGKSRALLPSEAARRTGRFCSKPCFAKVVIANPESWVIAECGTCKTSFRKLKVRLTTIDYCSRACAVVGRRRENAKWRDPVQIAEYMAKYRIKNLDRLKVGSRINVQNRRARKRANGGVLSKGLAEKLFKLQQGKCPCCSKSLGKNYHLDHKTPIAMGGVNEDWNMQLLRDKCNLSKASKDPISYMQERGFLL